MIKTKLQFKYMLLFLSIALLGILACNALVPVPSATPSLVPPTATSISLAEKVVLSSVSLRETNQIPAYAINAEIPTLQGSTDARVVTFNMEMTKLVHGEIDSFKKNSSKLPNDPTFASSFFDVIYTLMLQSGDIWGLKLDFSGYASGAAHPYHYSVTVNYDLGQGKELALSDLFLPNSNYLEAISSYCIMELSKRDIAFDMFSEGAAPTPENYRNWNITADGLMITFDEYQVAPYAAGPQTVIVPYGVLQPMIDPLGPLGKLSQ